MCGVFGYIGKRSAVDIVIKGLKRLEYRGYDSAGIGGVIDSKIEVCKEIGKVSGLEELAKASHLVLDLAIAQTRWATHGVPSRVNAHPHVDMHKTVAIVHNGIIENHNTLRKKLKQTGVHFLSETDSEVIAHLIAGHYEGNFLKAVQKTTAELKGSYAILCVHVDHPDKIIAVAHESPLSIGIGHGEAFISSDPQAFGEYTKDAVFLTDGEIAVVKKEKLEIYNIHEHKIEKKAQKLSNLSEEISKGDYEHFTLKEIFEQPQMMKNAMLSRFVQDWGTAQFEELKWDTDELHGIQRLLIIACGTSLHAGMIAASMIEEMARIPVQVEISSEFRYKNPIVPHGTLAVAISQSGETADTLAAVRELKAKGVHVFALCNVHGSSLVREADATLFLRAGPEIGVCSTKAFTNQLIVLSLFSLMLARMQHYDKEDGIAFLQELKKLPEQAQLILDKHEEIQKIAKRYAKFENFFFLGRQAMYPTALEGALKLKEISYINANGYPAGEMKHGPIALIHPDCPTVAFTANAKTYDKLISNLMEVKARQGKVIAIVDTQDESITELADDCIQVPKTCDSLAPVLSSIAAQLLAYYIAKERGAEIDQPRNLAKSVTVE